ncbi:ABC transporter permease [Jhaorihella thermophila]|uniref:Putative ABC transport system permease protein n=1 Tax=Jhaorihella thermophila TaxID=488547 RepID=A0A1H5WAD7_9RHOB|nr:putative ABC transport system permease protein [Jhaorihella thermophila]
MNVRAPDTRRMRPALVVPSGAGDPTLPAGVTLGRDRVAISAQLAAQLMVREGAALQLVSQAEGRPRQLVLPVTVAAVLPERAVAGRAVLAPLEMLEVIEAFYDSYSLPEYGIEGTRDLDERAPAYAGLRVYARDLASLAPLQARIESALGAATTARTRDVESLLGLGRRLDLALALTAALAAGGMGEALVFGFWSDAARKRQVLAGIALLGVPARDLALFPMVQGLVTAALGLALSFVLYAIAGQVAQAMFGQGMPEGAALAVIGPGQGAAICAAVLALVLGAAGAAAWSVQRVDPARVLREGA